VIFSVLIGFVVAHPGGGGGGYGGRQSGSGCSGDRNGEEERNKRIVLRFYQELFGDKDLTAIDRYISAAEYIQHNPTVADGSVAFKTAATTWFQGASKVKVDIRRVAADGDLVWVHVKDGNQAIVDIFRLSCGKIVEHWDVIQNIPSSAANTHPMF